MDAFFSKTARAADEPGTEGEKITEILLTVMDHITGQFNLAEEIRKGIDEAVRLSPLGVALRRAGYEPALDWKALAGGPMHARLDIVGTKRSA